MKMKFGSGWIAPTCLLVALLLPFSALAALVDEVEPNNYPSQATLIRNGDVLQGEWGTANDREWAKFVVGGSGAAHVLIRSPDDEPGWGVFSVYRGSGALIGHVNGPGFPSDVATNLPFLTPGTYFVKKDTFFETGTWSLSINWSAPGDAYEPDDAASQAKAIARGQTQIRSIHAAGNSDWAKFSVPNAGARNVVVQTGGSSGDTQMWLYKGSGAQVGFNDDIGGGILFSKIAAARLTAGTYFIKVVEYQNNGTIPAYTLRATWTSP